MKNESPAKYADRLGLQYSALVTERHKKELGQFFTPLDIGRFMAGFALVAKNRIRILDPGCGVGILSCTVVEFILEGHTQILEIELTAFESDINLLAYTDKCLIYLSTWAQNRGIKFTYFLCKNDFILHNSAVLQNDNHINELYEIVITNPPYFKIPKKDLRAKVAKSVIYGQSNIYSIFLLIAVKLLSQKGQLIFITPRSFASGFYFRLFREKFFSEATITNIHLFDSRKDAFSRDKILQENIIVVAIKKGLSDNLLFLTSDDESNSLKISSSLGVKGLGDSITKEYQLSKLVSIESYHKILHIPVSQTDDKAIELFKTWKGSLHLFGMEISTGPVVDFRSREFIVNEHVHNSVPLLYLHNIEKMMVVWPKLIGKGKNKGQYIIANNSSRSRLVERKDYILLRRFSSKDDHSRLVAAPYFSDDAKSYSLIGIENHLNYIYKPYGILDKREVWGLSAILNSKLFDIYFRTFNGNINVSATEMRNMPLPSLDVILQIGEKLMLKGDYSQKFIDCIVQDKFHIDLND